MESAAFGERLYFPAKMAAVVDALIEEGVAPAETLRGTHMSADELHQVAARVSLNQLIECYRNAVALSRNPHLPYAIGSSVHLSAYGMYGYAMLCSTDFRRTMEFAVRYHQLATPLAKISFEERDQTAIWAIDPLLHPRIDSRLYRFVTELQIGTHISLHRDIMGPAFVPREITLTYPPATDFRITQELAGCPVRFEQSMNRTVFDATWLDAAPRLGNRTTYPAAVALCDDLLAEFTLRAGMAGEVRSILLRDIANRPTFAATAKLLKTTTRTLRRQLRLQNTSFRELSDELLVYVAMKYLRDTAMTNEDIAFALGFSDEANFRHAFRRWTKKTPREFRREVSTRYDDQTVKARARRDAVLRGGR
jgi:AraC-like DNA-binding protein